MTCRLIGLIVGVGTGLLLVIAAERIDLFDTKSNRIEYIVVHPRPAIRHLRHEIERTAWGDDHAAVWRPPGL
jgi:hypothetical protein